MHIFEIKTEPDKEILCRECGEEFGEWKELGIHRENAHKVYSCKCCLKQETSLVDFEYHLETHGGVKFFKCIICTEDFSYLIDLNEHLQCHLLEKNEIPCDESIEPKPAESYEQKEVFTILKEEKDEQDDINKSLIADFDLKPDLDVEDSNTVLFASPLPLLQSECANLVELPPKRRRTGSRRPISEKKRIEYALLEKKFKCAHCLYSCKTKSNLKLHMRVHTGERPFKCSLCKNGYACKSSLKIHMTMKHDENKKRKYKCKICGKSFFAAIRLRTHERQMHEEKEKSYPCSYCGKIYTTKGSLAIHLYHHRDTGDNNCPECNKKFQTRIALLAHKRNVHTTGNKHPCTWENCNYQGLTPNALKIHTRKHTGERPFQCEICDFRMSTKYGLKQHKSLWHGPPPTLQCDHCDKVFKQKGHLQRHCKRVHLERNIPCPVCNKMYGSISDVSRHIRDSHPEEYKRRKAAINQSAVKVS